MSNKFLFPRIDNYYSDWHQLTFVLARNERFAGIYYYNEDVLGRVHSQAMALNLSKLNIKHLDTKEKPWELFIYIFNKIWLHEWLHLVGLTEKGIKLAKEIGFPTA